jgi:hypothetical protein
MAFVQSSVKRHLSIMRQIFLQSVIGIRSDDAGNVGEPGSRSRHGGNIRVTMGKMERGRKGGRPEGLDLEYLASCTNQRLYYYASSHHSASMLS